MNPGPKKAGRTAASLNSGSGIVGAFRILPGAEDKKLTKRMAT